MGPQDESDAEPFAAQAPAGESIPLAYLRNRRQHVLINVAQVPAPMGLDSTTVLIHQRLIKPGLVQRYGRRVLMYVHNICTWLPIFLVGRGVDVCADDSAYRNPVTPKPSTITPRLAALLVTLKGSLKEEP